MRSLLPAAKKYVSGKIILRDAWLEYRGLAIKPHHLTLECRVLTQDCAPALGGLDGNSILLDQRNLALVDITLGEFIE